LRSSIPAENEEADLRQLAWVFGLPIFAILSVAVRANADVIVGWDWNDGTTQGWQGNSNGGATNVASRLLVFNNGNGSLQMFGPLLTGTAASDWSHLSEIRFDVEILSLFRHQ
jgi:hypothetical protein